MLPYNLIPSHQLVHLKIIKTYVTIHSICTWFYTFFYVIKLYIYLRKKELLSTFSLFNRSKSPFSDSPSLTLKVISALLDCKGLRFMELYLTTNTAKLITSKIMNMDIKTILLEFLAFSQ